MIDVKEVTVKEAKKLIYETKGRFFKAIFRKRTGEREIRTMICRLGVKKGVKGIGMSYNPEDYNLVTVFDLQKNAFRHISLDTLLFLKINHVLYAVVKDEKEEKNK